MGDFVSADVCLPLPVIKITEKILFLKVIKIEKKRGTYGSIRWRDVVWGVSSVAYILCTKPDAKVHQN